MTLVIIGFDARFIITKTSQEKLFFGGEQMEKSIAKEKRRKGSQVFIVGFVVNFIITIFNPWI
jgi:hypothetical protein